jgi:pilus assembly protein FimV
VYSPSQLDAAGDVDPVAEADVYLAYGRDLQAEEILKEAMRTSPMRVAIHAKLMEIYAKRRDSKAFETVAIEAFNLTHGNGPEWAYITEMGRELDPANPMYQPGGQPAGRRQSGGTSAFSPGGTVAMVAQPVMPGACAAPAPAWMSTSTWTSRSATNLMRPPLLPQSSPPRRRRHGRPSPRWP